MVLLRSQMQNERITDSDSHNAQLSDEPIFDLEWGDDTLFSAIAFNRSKNQRRILPHFHFPSGKRLDLLKKPNNLFFLGWLILIWIVALGYLHFAKPSYSAHFKIILPGAGSVSSVNITDIGQATSNASSPFSSLSLSPTVTYKNLIMSSDILEAAATRLGTTAESLPVPKVKLTDETSSILVEMTGQKPDVAQSRAIAIQDAFFLGTGKASPA